MRVYSECKQGSYVQKKMRVLSPWLLNYDKVDGQVKVQGKYNKWRKLAQNLWYRNEKLNSISKLDVERGRRLMTSGNMYIIMYVWYEHTSGYVYMGTWSCDLGLGGRGYTL